jgi:L-lactate utilization protein LutB
VDRVEEIRKKIEDLKKRWPAHSVPPALVMELDELEAALEEALKERREGKSDAEADRGR